MQVANYFFKGYTNISGHSSWNKSGIAALNSNITEKNAITSPGQRRGEVAGVSTKCG
jgi:hypothetical protein